MDHHTTPGDALAGAHDPRTRAVENSPVAASRRLFLRRSAAVALAGGAAAILTADGRPAFAQDADDERAAIAAPGQRGPISQRRDFNQIRKHENAHVAALVGVLGADARPKPNFRNLEKKNYGGFLIASQNLENTGVGAYLAATPVINDPMVLAAAGSIAAIEARHAGFLNNLRGDPITGNLPEKEVDHAFETPLTIDQVVAAASPFIQDLNGGPPLTFSTTPSPANDLAILNFALALEYLEAEFYNVNFAKFFPSQNE